QEGKSRCQPPLDLYLQGVITALSDAAIPRGDGRVRPQLAVRDRPRARYDGCVVIAADRQPQAVRTYVCGAECEIRRQLPLDLDIPLLRVRRLEAWVVVGRRSGGRWRGNERVRVSERRVGGGINGVGVGYDRTAQRSRPVGIVDAAVLRALAHAVHQVVEEAEGTAHHGSRMRAPGES